MVLTYVVGPCSLLLSSALFGECSQPCSHLPSFTVRPRLLFLRLTVLPFCFRHFLRNRGVSRSPSRTATPHRRVSILRLCAQPKPSPLEASHHRPTRGVRILLHSSQGRNCFHRCEWNCQREHASSQTRMWQIPSRKEEHLHGATTQRQQGKQYCGAASNRHVVHEVTSCLSASHPSYPCVPLPPYIT